MDWASENFISDVARDRKLEKDFGLKERIMMGLDSALYHKCGKFIGEVDFYSCEEIVCERCKEVIHEFDCHELVL